MTAPPDTITVSRLRATLASLGEGVIATDLHATVVELNPEAERLTGWTGTEARGQPLDTVFSLLDERTATPVTGLAQTVLRHGAVVGGSDTLLVARDGTRRPVAHTAAPIRDEIGAIQGVALVFSDQTTQQAAQRALRASEERLRLALAAAHQGLYDLNLQTGECVVSPEYARLLGEDPSSFREDYAAWVARMHPDDRPAVRQAYEDYVAGRRSEHRIEYRQRAAGGQWKWLLSVGRLAARSADGRPLRLLGTHTDISARKDAEAALRDSLHEKEALLREVHHRVKNNLQIISSLLRLEAAGIDHPLTRAVLQDMQHRIRSMALLHETLYRSDNLARVHLRPYLERLCAQLFRSLLRQPGAVQLHLDIAPVRLDPAQAIPCGLIVNELVSNSLKHAFPGGAGGAVHVELQPLPPSPEFRLSVRDTGVGLPATLEPDRLRSLGLQLVSDLTRQLEGTLAIERGPGARFTITFRPAGEPEARAEARPGSLTT
ncbi:MAG: PAS domain S-box protein [Verrucomicrobiales bacterium]|nr:PAS domain S-box protein [Verrucomicrobiales bacterium]